MPLARPRNSGTTLGALLGHALASNRTYKTGRNESRETIPNATSGPNGNDPSMSMILSILHSMKRERENTFPESALIAANRALNCGNDPWKGFLLENDQGVCALDLLGAASKTIPGTMRLIREIQQSGKPQPNPNPRATEPNPITHAHVALYGERDIYGDPKKTKTMRRLAFALDSLNWRLAPGFLTDKEKTPRPLAGAIKIAQLRAALREATKAGFDLDKVRIAGNFFTGETMIRDSRHPIQAILCDWNTANRDTSEHLSGIQRDLEQASTLIMDACNRSCLTEIRHSLTVSMPGNSREAMPEATLARILIRTQILKGGVPEPILALCHEAETTAHNQDDAFHPWLAKTLADRDLHPNEADRAMEYFLSLDTETLRRENHENGENIPGIIQELIMLHEKEWRRAMTTACWSSTAFSLQRRDHWKEETMEAMKSGKHRIDVKILRSGINRPQEKSNLKKTGTNSRVPIPAPDGPGTHATRLRGR